MADLHRFSLQESSGEDCVPEIQVVPQQWPALGKLKCVLDVFVSVPAREGIFVSVQSRRNFFYYYFFVRNKEEIRACMPVCVCECVHLLRRRGLSVSMATGSDTPPNQTWVCQACANPSRCQCTKECVRVFSPFKALLF